MGVGTATAYRRAKADTNRLWVSKYLMDLLEVLILPVVLVVVPLGAESR